MKKRGRCTVSATSFIRTTTAKGYATEACRAAMDHLFRRLGADRVVTGTAAANEPSCRLLRRLEMPEVGRHTASSRKTDDGQPIEFEAISFAISREEWAC